MMEFFGKTVFITGGGGGIGGGIAQAFAECGAQIVLADINTSFAQEEAHKLPADVQVQVVPLDVCSLDSWGAARESAEARFGAIDVLCNNAGISPGFKPLVDVAPEEFSRLMEVNVTGVYNGVLTFAPAMTERGSGHIVNTSSMNGLIPFASFAAYSASKFAVLALSDALREELGSAGVGVSTLFPGLTRSRMAEADLAGSMPDKPKLLAALRVQMMDPVWLGRSVVRAVERNEPYIVTHPEYRENLAVRHAAVLSAFGDPAQPGFLGGGTATILGG